VVATGAVGPCRGCARFIEDLGAAARAALHQIGAVPTGRPVGVSRREWQRRRVVDVRRFELVLILNGGGDANGVRHGTVLSELFAEFEEHP
jgi:hypothetical protein